MPRPSSGLLLFVLLLLVVGILATFGPPEAALGTHARLAYLHSAWVSSFLALLAVSLLACWLLAHWLLASWVRYRHEPAR